MSKFNATLPQAVVNVITSDKREIALSAGATYNTWDVVSSKGFAQLKGFVYADQDSAVSGLKIYQSVDGGANWDLVDSYTVLAGTTFKVILNIYGEKLKVTYENGAVDATVRIGMYLMPIDSDITIEGVLLGTVKISDSSGNVINPAKEDGNLADILAIIEDQLGEYNISDTDTTSPNYYGFLAKDGSWFILKETISGVNTAYRYCKGASNYTTAWAGRGGLTYDYFDVIF